MTTHQHHITAEYLFATRETRAACYGCGRIGAGVPWSGERTHQGVTLPDKDSDQRATEAWRKEHGA